MRTGYSDNGWERKSGRWTPVTRDFGSVGIRRGWINETGRSSWFMKPRPVESLRNIARSAFARIPWTAVRADAMLEVVRNHQFALAQTAGGWEMIESSGFKNGNLQNQTEAVSERLQRLSATVLEERDQERRWIATQLHEVTAQNVFAIAVYLAAFQQKRSSSSAAKFTLAKCHALCENSLEQILTLSHLLHPLTLDQLGL